MCVIFTWSNLSSHCLSHSVMFIYVFSVLFVMNYYTLLLLLLFIIITTERKKKFLIIINTIIFSLCTMTEQSEWMVLFILDLNQPWLHCKRLLCINSGRKQLKSAQTSQFFIWKFESNWKFLVQWVPRLKNNFNWNKQQYFLATWITTTYFHWFIYFVIYLWI